jgi:ABC-type antimicrobial peptide transport system permease subunit
VRAIVPRPDDSVRVTNFRTQTDQIALTFARERQIAALASTAGLLALALTSIGLYGLLSYSVSRQTQEFGVRFALGARRRHVVGRVLRETMWLVGVGLVLGLVLGSTLTQLVSTILFGLAPHDPSTLAASAVLITIVGLVSVLRPALRAARVDPLTALRYE